MSKRIYTDDILKNSNGDIIGRVRAEFIFFKPQNTKEMENFIKSKLYLSDINFQQENKHLQQQLDQALKDYEEQLKINEEHQKLNGELQVRISEAIEILKKWHEEYNGLLNKNVIYISEKEDDLFNLLEKLKGESNG